MKPIRIAGLLLLAMPLAAAELSFDGEIAARESASISPPEIDDLWQLALTQLAADGTPVKQGEVVAAFDSSEVLRTLSGKQSALKEKETQRERLRLELEERERTEALATADLNTGDQDPGTSGFNVTTALRAWTAGESNHGWAFQYNTSDAWMFAASEHESLLLRPRLVVAWKPAGAL